MVMFGRMVDAAALTVLGTGALYLFYLNAGFGVWASAGLAFVGMALLRAAWVRRPWRGRVTRGQGEAAVDAIARMPEDAAREVVGRLTGTGDAALVLKPASARLSPAELFALWRAHMGEALLTVAATCPADPDALALLDTLAMPRVTLLDRAALAEAARKADLHIPDAPPKPVKRRVPVPRAAALHALPLLALYRLNRNPLGLAAAVLIVAGAVWKGERGRGAGR